MDKHSKSMSKQNETSKTSSLSMIVFGRLIIYCNGWGSPNQHI